MTTSRGSYVLTLAIVTFFWLIGLSVPASSSTLVAPTNSSVGPDLIGFVQPEHVAYGCNCDYRFKGDSSRFLYSSDIDGKTAWMNIDGHDVKLRLLSSPRPAGTARKGQQFTSDYAARGVTVRIANTVTRVLEDGDELTDYAATITVIKGNRKQTIRVVGECGC